MSSVPVQVGSRASFSWRSRGASYTSHGLNLATPATCAGALVPCAETRRVIVMHLWQCQSPAGRAGLGSAQSDGDAVQNHHQELFCTEVHALNFSS